MEKSKNYVILVSPLSEDDGGGYLARVPDLPGCFGDGESRESAILDAENAIKEWVEEYEKMGRDVPEPGSTATEYKRQRTEELRLLNDCVSKLRSSEKEIEGLDERISAVEKEARYLTDFIENLEGWSKFHIIMKTTRQPIPELFC